MSYDAVFDLVSITLEGTEISELGKTKTPHKHLARFSHVAQHLLRNYYANLSNTTSFIRWTALGYTTQGCFAWVTEGLIKRYYYTYV